MQLLKTWEGCRLTAYPDPASGGDPWTIGYGHSGPEVSPGLTISQARADALERVLMASERIGVRSLVVQPHRQRRASSICTWASIHRPATP